MGTLADLSQELAVATDVDDLARAVSRHVPAIVGAELAGVAVVERVEGRVRLLPNSSLPADLTAMFGEIDLGTASPVAAAARDGEVLLLGDQDAIKTGMLPQEAGALAASGFSAVGVAPLTVEGSVAAIVGVAWRSKKPVDAAQETGLRTVSEVCTRTLERIEAARVIVERETGLATLARKLSTAATHDDVTGVMFAEARRVVGAFHANVGMLEPGGGALLTKGSMLPEDVAQRQRRLPLDAGLPLTDAILRNETVLLEDLGAMQARYSDIVNDARASGFAALAALPLHDTAGTPMGVLSMAWSAPLRVDACAALDAAHRRRHGGADVRAGVDLADERVREGDLNRRLADVGERLATAGSTEEVVATLAASAADVVGARSAAVGVLDTGRGILHMVDDERQEGWTTSLSDLPQDPAARAVDSRAGVVSEGSPDDAADGGTVVAEPLLDHRRQPVGALRVAFAPEEVVAPRARRAVRRLAEMAAQALERASITDAEHRRTSLLAAYATQLSAARGVDEVIAVVVTAGGLPVDADEVRVGLVDDVRDVLVIHRAAAASIEAPEERLLRPGLDAATDAVLRREPVLIGNGDEWRRHFPDAAPKLRKPVWSRPASCRCAGPTAGRSAWCPWRGGVRPGSTTRRTPPSTSSPGWPRRRCNVPRCGTSSTRSSPISRNGW